MPQEPSAKPKPYLFILAVGLLIYLGANVSSTLYKSYQNRQRLQSLQNQVSQLQQQKVQLQKQLQYQQSSRFVEQEARNKLGMAKTSEVVVIFPRSDDVLGTKIATSTTTKATSSSPIISSNLVAWTKLFW